MRRSLPLPVIALFLLSISPALGQECPPDDDPLELCSDTLQLRNGRRRGAPQDEFLQDGAGRSRVEIEGCPAARAVTFVKISPLEIEVIETTEDPDAEYRTFQPGQPIYGNVTLRAPALPQGARGLRSCFVNPATGQLAPKNVSVVILGSNGAEARRYNLMECFPIRFDPGDYSPANRRPRAQTAVLAIGGVELDLGPGDPPPGPPPATLPGTRPFQAEFYWRPPNGGKNEDNAWETCTGGSLCVEATPAANGSGEHHVATPGHKFVDEIQLRGPMTKSRRWIGKNINDTVKGSFTRFDLTIVEIMKDGKDGKRFNYSKAFFTRYVYPTLSADGTGNLYEEVSIKPERLRIKDCSEPDDPKDPTDPVR